MLPDLRLVCVLEAVRQVMLSSGVILMQVYCYEDSKLLKLFSNVVRILYDADIVGEDTIKFWYKKGSHPKVRNCKMYFVASRAWLACRATETFMLNGTKGDTDIGQLCFKASSETCNSL